MSGHSGQAKRYAMMDLMGETKPLTHAERGAMGAAAARESMTPEQKKARARAGHLAGAVKAVIGRMDDLTDEQRQAIRAALDRA